MSALTYQILHVGGVLLMFGLTFSCFAAPRPERKRLMLSITGLLAVVVLVGGFGLVARLHGNQFTGWMVAKIVVWLAVAAMGGIAFRRPHFAGLFAWITAILGLIAVVLVYTRPSIFGF